MKDKLVKKIERIYDECEKTISPDLTFSFNAHLIKDMEKRHFYWHIYNYFLKKRQKEVIENEKY